MKSASNMGLLAVTYAALLAVAPSAQAMMIAPPTPGVRVAQAQTIVVGKVESIEEKTVSAKQFPHVADKIEYQIAVIKIEDPILAAKGLTHVRVGFLPPPMGRPGLVTPRRPGVSFTKGQEVLVFLQPHFDGNFLIAAAYYDVVNKQGNANFEKDVAAAKKFVKLLANAKESLKAEKAEDRFTAAGLLISQYRARRFGVNEPKTEAIDVEISKLILTALAEADWKNPGPPMVRMNPQTLFMQLGLTDKDGFTPPMREIMGQKQIDFTKYANYAKQWCKDNAGKYKIQRFVYDNSEKNDK